MLNKEHKKYIDYFKKNISSITTVDIPNQPNSIKGDDLKKKFSTFRTVNYKSSIEEALKSLKLKDEDMILITGSLYLAGQVLKNDGFKIN